MVAGIVLFALAMKKTLENFDDPLKTVPAVALCGGLALYLLAHVLLRVRISGSLESRPGFVQRVGRGRPLAVLALIALLPAAVEVPALAALACVAAVFVALIAYEALRYRESRAQIRGGADPTEEVMSRARARP
jgi:low temperature requirement protein LtrA